MNFMLKGTDTYESLNRSGKIGVRIVDAKFALPKREEEEASRFVCLDMPEYPSEHDDITITFESEQGKFSVLFTLQLDLVLTAMYRANQISLCSTRCSASTRPHGLDATMSHSYPPLFASSSSSFSSS
jgi:hypothetical protein